MTEPIIYTSFLNEILSIYDIWSIQHFSFGVFIGAFVSLFNKKHIKKLLNTLKHPDNLIIQKTTWRNIFYFDLILLLLIAYSWESFEHYIDIGYFGTYLQSFTQHETFTNRFFGDPSVLVIGYFLSVKFIYLKYIALVFVSSFFCFHIFVDRIF